MSQRLNVSRRASSPSTLFLPVIAAAVFMVVLTDNVVNIIVPMLATTFDASVAHVNWTITGYALVLAVGVPLYGRVSDVWGVRRVFSLAFPLFALGSLACALAPDLGLLVAGRILQGTGAAGIPAVATVAVAKLLPAGQRGAAFGIIGSTVGAGAAAGPIVGGVLSQYLGWRALFVGLMALAMLLHVVALRVLPRAAAGGRRSFDLPGGLLIGGAAGLLLFGVTNLQGYGATAFATWGSFSGALLAAGGFAWRIAAARQPFVPPALFRNRGYMAALLTAFLTMTAYLSLLVFVPLLLVEAGGLSSAQAGLVLTPGALLMAVLSPRAGRLSDRIGARPLIVTGLALLAAAALFLSSLGAGNALLIAGAAVLAADLGLALLNAPTTNAAAGALADEDSGAGLGIYRAAFFLGAGSGPAAFGALLAARAATHGHAVNPLYRLADTAYSDTFLAIAATALAGLIVAALGLRGSRSRRRAGAERAPGVGAEHRQAHHHQAAGDPATPATPNARPCRSAGHVPGHRPVHRQADNRPASELPAPPSAASAGGRTHVLSGAACKEES